MYLIIFNYINTVQDRYHLYAREFIEIWMLEKPHDPAR